MEEEFNLENAVPAENQEFYGGTSPEEEEDRRARFFFL